MTMLDVFLCNSFQRWAIAYAADRGITLTRRAQWVQDSAGRQVMTEQGVRAYCHGVACIRTVMA